MVNISKQKIDTSDYKLAVQQFQRLLSSLNKTSAPYFVNELLTKAEQIMLTKRLATILLLSQNQTPYRVSQTIALSISTVQRLYEQYQEGHYDNLLQNINKKQKNEFLSLINDLILAQASPRARARIMNRVL